MCENLIPFDSQKGTSAISGYLKKKMQEKVWNKWTGESEIAVQTINWCLWAFLVSKFGNNCSCCHDFRCFLKVRWFYDGGIISIIQVNSKFIGLRCWSWCMQNIAHFEKKCSILPIMHDLMMMRLSASFKCTLKMHIVTRFNNNILSNICSRQLSWFM